MQELKNINTNSILIIPYQIKDKVLKYLNQEEFINIKIMTFEELKKGLFFDYDLKTIDYVMQKYDYTYEIACDYLKNLYFISNFDNDKNKFLINLKNDLDNNNLLIYDKLFVSLLKSKTNLYVYGFDYLQKYEEYLLNIASKYTKVEIIKEPKNEYKHELLVFDQIEEEVIFVAEEICKLIQKGISLDHIFIANYDPEYEFVIKRIFDIYAIPFYLKGDNSIYMTSLVKYFVDNIGPDINKSLYKTAYHFKTTENKENEQIYNKLVNTLNEFYWCNDLSIKKDLLINKLKKTKTGAIHFKNEIAFTDILNNIFSDEDYVFLINFNVGKIPSIKKDEDYINDDIKPEFLDKSYELNGKIKHSTIMSINNIKNLFITCKKNTPSDTYEVANFMENTGLEVKTIVTKNAHFSDEINHYLLENSIDEYVKYGQKSAGLHDLYNSYQTNYKTYNNQYTKIDEDYLLQNAKLNFSYSNISDYYKCPFKFYVQNILKINEFKVELAGYIGSLFHYVLEKCIKDEALIDEAYEKYLTENPFEGNNKDKYFISEVKKELAFIVETINKQMANSDYKEIITEQIIEIPYKGKLESNIKGFVDKMLKNGSDYVIVDYKTGSVDLKKEYFEYGLYIQLPIYLYLVKHFDENANVVGIYLQHILNSKPTFDPLYDSTLISEKKLKLEGLTVNDISKIKEFDKTYEKSDFIKGISLKKDGTLKSNNNLITYEEQKEIYNITEKLIFDCIQNVEKAIFDVHPILVEKVANGCDFCPYKDICFKKPEDINRKEIIKKENKEEV